MHSIELEILSYLITAASSYKVIHDNNVSSSLFIEQESDKVNTYKILFDLLLSYYKTYGSILTRESLVATLKNYEYSKDILLAYDKAKFNEIKNPLIFSINLLKESYKAFSLKKLLLDAEKMYNSNNISELFDLVKYKVVDIQNKVSTDFSESLLDDSIDERLDSYTHPKEQGVKVGYPTFDTATNGLLPGQLMVIAAGTSEGKSVMMLNMGYNAWRHGKNVLYITIENYKNDLLRRIDSLSSRIPYYKLRKGMVNEEESKALQASFDEMKNISKNNVFYIVDKPSECTPDFIEAKLTDLSYIHFDLVVVDYLHIMSLGIKNKVERDQYYGNLAAELRRVGRVKKVPIITAVQVNREGMKQKDIYDVSHIALSQFIANHADIILSIRSKDPNQILISGVVDLEAAIVKHRDGPRKKFDLKANFEIMRMEEVSSEIDTAPIIDTDDLPPTPEVPAFPEDLLLS